MITSQWLLTLKPKNAWKQGLSVVLVWNHWVSEVPLWNQEVCEVYIWNQSLHVKCQSHFDFRNSAIPINEGNLSTQILNPRYGSHVICCSDLASKFGEYTRISAFFLNAKPCNLVEMYKVLGRIGASIFKVGRKRLKNFGKIYESPCPHIPEERRFNFSFCGTTAKFGPRPLVVEAPRSHIIRHTQLDTPGRTFLNEWSARRTGHNLHKAQQTPETNTHVVSGIRTLDPNNEATADLRLILHGHRYRYAALIPGIIQRRNAATAIYFMFI